MKLAINAWIGNSLENNSKIEAKEKNDFYIRGVSKKSGLASELITHVVGQLE